MNDRVRLVSVDAFRGITVAAMLLVNNPGSWQHIYGPLRHAEWHSATPTDLVFPFFLFIVGVSAALALLPHVEAGHDNRLLRRGVLMRAARIVLLGLALQAFNYVLHDMPHFRPFGVLQRIGICFAAVGMFAIYTKPRTQWIALSSLLLGYWAMMAWGGDMTREGNLAARFDTWLLGPWCYQYDPVSGMGFEPEGVLSTLPAIGTALLGLRAGDWLRRGDVQRLWSMGTYAVLFGFVWSLVFPINKQLWTSSYVLWTGGLAMIALGTFHALMDKKRMPPIGKSFGMNAIFAYAGAWLLASVLGATGAHQALYANGFGWMIPRFSAEAASLSYAIVFVALWWLVVKGLDRRKIHLKI